MKIITNIILGLVTVGILLLVLAAVFNQQSLYIIGIILIIIGLGTMFIRGDEQEDMIHIYTITIKRNGKTCEEYYKEFKQEGDAIEYCENLVQSYECTYDSLGWEVEYKK